VPDNGGDRGECFAFTGLHLGDLSVRQGQSTLQLHVEQDQTQDPCSDYGGDGYRLNEVFGSSAGLSQRFIANIAEFASPAIDLLDSVWIRNGPSKGKTK
jgi:hypothetical protein